MFRRRSKYSGGARCPSAKEVVLRNPAMNSGKELLGSGALLTTEREDGCDAFHEQRLGAKSRLCGLVGECVKPMLRSGGCAGTSNTSSLEEAGCSALPELLCLASEAIVLSTSEE